MGGCWLMTYTLYGTCEYCCCHPLVHVRDSKQNTIFWKWIIILEHSHYNSWPVSSVISSHYYYYISFTPIFNIVIILVLLLLLSLLCWQTHIPGFLEEYDKLKAKGVDLIVCVSVNDAFVMSAWAKQQKTMGKIRMLADTLAEFTQVKPVHSTHVMQRSFTLGM